MFRKAQQVHIAEPILRWVLHSALGISIIAFFSLLDNRLYILIYILIKFSFLLAINIVVRGCERFREEKSWMPLRSV